MSCLITSGGETGVYPLRTAMAQPGSPELCLAGTAEIPLAGLFANKVIDESSLPKRVVGVGKAFRAEAGARGSDTRGLYRVHQFTKVELFTVCQGEDGMGDAEMERMRRVQILVAVAPSSSVGISRTL
jgi:seryl-tRNA synthetase